MAIVKMPFAPVPSSTIAFIPIAPLEDTAVLWDTEKFAYPHIYRFPAAVRVAGFPEPLTEFPLPIDMIAGLFCPVKLSALVLLF